MLGLRPMAILEGRLTLTEAFRGRHVIWFKSLPPLLLDFGPKRLSLNRLSFLGS